MHYFFLRCVAAILLYALVARGGVVVHDDSFHPDYVLRVVAQNYSQACIERYSVLVNGSAPGPELRLREGKITWIRVHNDMTDTNFTMVITILSLSKMHPPTSSRHGIGLFAESTSV